MLATYLTISPLSKFVLIEDCLEHEGKAILKSIIKLHQTNQSSPIHYFQFEGLFKNTTNIICYDCVSNCKGWLQSYNDHFTNVAQISNNAIIIIDSLVHLILQYGFKTAYSIFQKLILNKEILQIITIFHDDLDTSLLQYFQHLSTFSIRLQPNSNRVLYFYKKPSGKVIKQIEIYSITHDILKSEKIRKIDPKTLVQQNLINPENLATFRIGLNNEEKELRDKVVLPYIYRDEVKKSDGEIFYEFDHTDDWDEEDPDDDLDI